MRESLKQKKSLGVLMGIALLLCGAGAIAYQSVGGSGGSLSIDRTAQGSFTIDDGATYFATDATKVPPFDYNGKPAVRARVYRCGDGKPFVAYLERYTAEGLKAQQILAAASIAKPGSAPGAGQPDPRTIQLAATAREVKRPGDKNWVTAMGAAGGKIASVKCPNGKDEPIHVEP